MKNWFQNWFNSPFYHILYQQHDDSEAELFIDRLLVFLQPEAHTFMLDLACGKGRFSKYLAHKGFDVTGVDLSEESIVAAQKFENQQLSFFQHDMRKLYRMQYFDYVFNFFTSFGYFENLKDNLKTLTSVHKGLKKDGVLVLDFFNADKVCQCLVPYEVKKIDGIEFSIYKKIENKIILKDIHFDFLDKKYHFQERVQALTSQDFEQLLTKSGFKIIAQFGDYQLVPFESFTSERLIIVAKKI